MGGDPHQPRFMGYLSFFTFAMLILVTANNFIQLFMGWELVGVASYLLINFWFCRLQANKSAIKAMLVNRVGDFGLALGIFTIFYLFKSFDYETVFSSSYLMVGTEFQSIKFLGVNCNSLNLIGILLFIGAVGKSAQLGLHTWLPDAMEGPTPVSALIHAATMVTAGVFLIIRCSPLYEFAPFSLTIITISGAATAFFAATTGLVQNDLKRVIAYSTCSQLGYMIFACGISSYNVAFFHLANHAFFKALLFLSAGSVIHGLLDEQDLRKMGGLVKLFPLTYSVMLIGSLSLIGFPFLTGFYSKDVILELAYSKYTIPGNFAHWLGTISVLFTSFYSFRLIYLTFLNKTNTYKAYIKHAHDCPPLLAIPLVILGFGSIFWGFLTKDMLIGLGTGFWGNSIFILPVNIIMINAEFIPTFIKLIPLFFTTLGAVLAYLFIANTNSITTNTQLDSVRKPYITKLYFKKIYTFLSKKWYFDQVYNEYLVQKSMNFGYHISFKLIDKGLIEMLGPYGISQLLLKVAKLNSSIQTGYLYHYAFIMLTGLTFIVIGLTGFTQLQTKLMFLLIAAFFFT